MWKENPVLDRVLLPAVLCLCISTMSFAETSSSQDEASLWDGITEDYNKTFPKITYENKTDESFQDIKYLRLAGIRASVSGLGLMSFLFTNLKHEKKLKKLIEKMGPGVKRHYDELVAAKEELKLAKSNFKLVKAEHEYKAVAAETNAVKAMREAEHRLDKAKQSFKNAKNNYKGVTKTLVSKFNKSQKAGYYATVGKNNAPRVVCGLVTLTVAADVVGTFLLSLQDREDNVISPTCTLIKIGAGNAISALTGPAEEDTRGASNEDQEVSSKKSGSSSKTTENHSGS